MVRSLALDNPPAKIPDDSVVRLADDQFEKLVELLTPGYDLAKTYLAQIEAQKAAEEAERAALQTAEPKDDTKKE